MLDVACGAMHTGEGGVRGGGITWFVSNFRYMSCWWMVNCFFLCLVRTSSCLCLCILLCLGVCAVDTVAVAATGEVYAWGDNKYGQVGIIQPPSQHVRSEVRLFNINLLLS